MKLYYSEKSLSMVIFEKNNECENRLTLLRETCMLKAKSLKKITGEG